MLLEREQLPFSTACCCGYAGTCAYASYSPSRRKRLALRAAGNFEITQGSVRTIGKQAPEHLRPGLARGILRSCLAFPREFGGKAGVYSAKSSATWSGEETGRLSLALGKNVCVRKCGSDILVRRL